MASQDQPRAKNGEYALKPASAPSVSSVSLANPASQTINSTDGENEINKIFTRFQEKYGRAPVIGLDLDGTTADMTAGFRPRVAEARGIDQVDATTHLPDPDDYAYSKSTTPWFRDREEFLEHFQAAEKSGFYRDLPVYDGAIDVLHHLAKKGFRIKAVTARSADYNPDTSHWLDSQGIPYEEILNPGFEKYTVEEVDIFIDDAPHVITGLVERERKVIIFNQQYNDHHNIDSESHTRRIEGWDLDSVAKALDALL